MIATYTTHEGDRLDLICWRHYGHHTGAVEAVLSANRGLADQPTLLPAGVTLTLPVLQAPAPTPVRLW